MLSSFAMQKVHPTKQKKLDKPMEKQSQSAKTKASKTNEKQQVTAAKGWKGYVIGEVQAKNKFGPPKKKSPKRPQKIISFFKLCILAYMYIIDVLFTI